MTADLSPDQQARHDRALERMARPDYPEMMRRSDAELERIRGEEDPNQQAPDLESIRERLGRATPAPWHYRPYGPMHGACHAITAAPRQTGGRPRTTVALVRYDMQWRGEHDGDITAFEDHRNATFIANAPSDIATLLAHIDRQQAEIDRLSNLCEFSAGSPEARLRAVFEFAEAECGHDGDSSIDAGITIRRFVAELKAEIDRLRDTVSSVAESLEADGDTHMLPYARMLRAVEPQQ